MEGTREQETVRPALQRALGGRYVLDRRLGRGGMGLVSLAREPRLARRVAIKVLSPDRAVQPAARERFLREARTAAGLSHPNIVPIFAVDEAATLVFFVMAYVEGETLGQRIRTRGPLPPAEVARVLKQVARALAYAHDHGVVHRDVKPDNILLENPTGRVLVTDFGIARVGAGGGTTGPREVVGTAEVMSPQQASGRGGGPRRGLYFPRGGPHFPLSGPLPLQERGADRLVLVRRDARDEAPRGRWRGLGAAVSARVHGQAGASPLRCGLRTGGPRGSARGGAGAATRGAGLPLRGGAVGLRAHPAPPQLRRPRRGGGRGWAPSPRARAAARCLAVRGVRRVGARRAARRDRRPGADGAPHRSQGGAPPAVLARAARPLALPGGRAATAPRPCRSTTACPHLRSPA